jgi:hypothetical protein
MDDLHRTRLTRFKDAAAVHGRRMNHMMSAGTQRLAIHRLTWATLAAAVVVVWQVPQIGALIPFAPHSKGELALTLVAAITSLSDFALWLCIFPIHVIPQRLLDQHVRDTWLARRTAWLDAKVGKRMDAVLDRLPQSGKWPLLLCQMLALLVRLSWATPLAIHLGVLGLWPLLRPSLDRMLGLPFIGAPAVRARVAVDPHQGADLAGADRAGVFGRRARRLDRTHGRAARPRARGGAGW